MKEPRYVNTNKDEKFMSIFRGKMENRSAGGRVRYRWKQNIKVQLTEKGGRLNWLMVAFKVGFQRSILQQCFLTIMINKPLFTGHVTQRGRNMS